jgi:hypothetical protein
MPFYNCQEDYLLDKIRAVQGSKSTTPCMYACGTLKKHPLHTSAGYATIFIL